MVKPVMSYWIDSIYCSKQEHTSDNCSCIHVQEIMRTFENTRNEPGPAILLPLKSLIIPKNGSYNHFNLQLFFTKFTATPCKYIYLQEEHTIIL